MKKLIYRSWPSLLMLTLLFLAWEVAPRVLNMPSIFLAPPSEVIKHIVEKPETLAHATVATLTELAGAAAIASIGGLLVGLAISSSKKLAFLQGWLGHLYAIPYVMLYPLFTIWLGLGQSSRILFGGFYGLIPMALAVGAALRSSDGSWTETARSFGASKAQQVVSVDIPLALPGIFAGLKLGVSLAFVGVIVGEMLASDRGLGFVLTSSRAIFDVKTLYGAVLVVMIFALVMNLLVDALERVTSPWPTGSGKESQ